MIQAVEAACQVWYGVRGQDCVISGSLDWGSICPQLDSGRFGSVLVGLQELSSQLKTINVDCSNLPIGQDIIHLANVLAKPYTFTTTSINEHDVQIDCTIVNPAALGI